MRLQGRERVGLVRRRSHAKVRSQRTHWTSWEQLQLTRSRNQSGLGGGGIASHSVVRCAIAIRLNVNVSRDLRALNELFQTPTADDPFTIKLM